MIKAKLDFTEPIAKNIRSFWFKPAHPVHYVAGQYIQMYLLHENPDERGEKHWFTLSSSPSESLLSVTTKFAGQYSSTFKQTLFSLKPGDELQISAPMGDFVLPKDESIPLVFIAGGIGVTPYRSIIKYLSDTSEHRSIQMVYGANSLEEIAFRNIFESYRLDFYEVPTNPPDDWPGPSGQLNAGKIEKIIGGFDDKLVYVAGPEPMVEALVKDLRKHGVHKDKLVMDHFLNYPAI